MVLNYLAVKRSIYETTNFYQKTNQLQNDDVTFEENQDLSRKNQSYILENEKLSIEMYYVFMAREIPQAVLFMVESSANVHKFPFHNKRCKFKRKSIGKRFVRLDGSWSRARIRSSESAAHFTSRSHSQENICRVSAMVHILAAGLLAVPPPPGIC